MATKKALKQAKMLKLKDLPTDVKIDLNKAKLRIKKLKTAILSIQATMPVFSNGQNWPPYPTPPKDRAVRVERRRLTSVMGGLKSIVEEQENIIKAIKQGKPLEKYDGDYEDDDYGDYEN